MKAIILAAGMGSRLGKYTQNLPKGMLEFNGKSLIQRQIETLKKVGISDISIVTGYRAEKINYEGIKYYHSELYSSTNMVESLFCAEKELTEDVLVCYSDIIYDSSIIEKISFSNVDIGVTVDNDYWEYWSKRLDNPLDDIESMIIEDNKIIELGREGCSREDALYRYVGLIKFSKKGVDILKEVYYKNKELYYDKNEKWLDSKSFKQAYLTSIIQAIINQGYEVNPIVISRGWMEFDNVKDYERANNWLKTGEIKKFKNQI